jgi:hypothetical protein
MKCPPILGPRELEFSGVVAQLGGGADEPFISEIGTLLPIALCGRKQTWTFAVGYFVTKSVAQPRKFGVPRQS